MKMKCYVSSSIKTDILYIADVLYDDNQKQYMAENRDQPSLWGFSFYHSLCIAQEISDIFHHGPETEKSSVRGRISKDDITTTLLLTLSVMLLKPYELPMHIIFKLISYMKVISENSPYNLHDNFV